MSKAFLDTTILADALLKPGPKAKAAKEALSRYRETQIPVYAIKEFKAGVLSNFIWLHNKFASTNSYFLTLEAVHSMVLSPRRYRAATAVEALSIAARAGVPKNLADLTKRFGSEAGEDKFLADQYMFYLQSLILRAWRKRRLLATRVVDELPCYDEDALSLNRGQIELGNTKCRKGKECWIAKEMGKKPHFVKALMDSIDEGDTRTENIRRRQALRSIYRKPGGKELESLCRSLGDAVFAFFAPDDADILTTNTRDHEPLAAALSKKVSTP